MQLHSVDSNNVYNSRKVTVLPLDHPVLVQNHNKFVITIFTMEQSLDILNKRIDRLNTILGPIPGDVSDANASSVQGGENLVDSLLSANTLLASALSGREKIADVVSRSAELESYLDPAYLDERQETKAKEVYINTVATDLAASFEILDKIKLLEPTLGAEYFRNIPDVTDKIRHMNNAASEQVQENDLIEQSLILAMQRYADIQEGIRDSLAGMNDRIDAIEGRLKKKSKPDVDV